MEEPGEEKSNDSTKYTFIHDQGNVREKNMDYMKERNRKKEGEKRRNGIREMETGEWTGESFLRVAG